MTSSGLLACSWGLGIQEHRIVHKEPVRYENILGQTLITTSAVRNRAGAATGGVGIVLSSSAKSSLASVTQHTDRILAANFQGNPATTVIVTYCPTNVDNEDNIEAHYDNLRRAIDSIPAHNVLVIVGDFNGRVGTGDWKNSLLNAEAYSTFSSIGSDHRIVTARIRLSLRKSKALSRKKHYDWRVLCSNNKLQQQYAIEVRNRFQPLEDINENATERYERFISATAEATEKIIPVGKKIRKACFSSDHRVTTARQKIKKAYETYQECTTEDNRLSYNQAKSDLAGAYNQAIEDDLNIKLREVEMAHDNCKHSQSWRLINDITGRKSSMRGQLKGDTQMERVSNWYHHFKDLLGSCPDIEGEDDTIEPITDDLTIEVGPFSHEEYTKAKTAIAEGKSSGEDGIPPEVLKRCDLDDLVLGFCNDALLKEIMPDQWSILNIIPIPKSGDLSQGGNYRGISLSSIVAKTFNRLILNRIRPKVDVLLRNNQNGFRVGRTTVSHILALRRILEGVKAKNLPAIITFIDFRKAFDTIHRGKMLQILRAYGIPKQLVDAIGRTYKKTRAKVIPDGETELFDIVAGVLQGDTLAPYLFVIVLDYALRMAIDGKEEALGFQLERRKSRRVGPEVPK
ncbi:uncharacterized protein [Amphiura filiformis]|uniref:uncharacterized protein n=1 Tax=Amphiura filiformis TaxID=82378 RepID=UPI003B20EAF1